MKTIERVGWNYEHLNIDEDGKNVHLIRDPNHESLETQYEIFRAVSEEVENGTFDRVLVEQKEGESPDGFKSREYVKKWCEGMELDMPATHLIAGMYPERKNLLYGVDDTMLRKFQSEFRKDFISLHKKSLEQGLSEEEFSEHEEADEALLKIFKARGFVAANNVVKYMDEHNLKNVGCVFGDLHFGDMVQSFKEKNVGVVSYFPGESDFSAEEGLAYLGRDL